MSKTEYDIVVNCIKYYQNLIGADLVKAIISDISDEIEEVEGEE